jgi:nicotinic acid mononucleotide adenylyltransferase
MLKHIVMFKLKDEYSGKSKNDLAKEIKEALEKLPQIIDEIKLYEVGINQLDDPRSYDLVLISGFDSLEGLEKYKQNPEHKKTLEFIMNRCLDVKVVDFFV